MNNSHLLLKTLRQKQRGPGASLFADSFLNGSTSVDGGVVGLSNLYVQRSVNQKSPLSVTAFGEESTVRLQQVVQDTIMRIENSTRYLQSPDSVDRTECFCPDTYTYLKSEKVFVPMPQYSMQHKYVTVDAKTLHYLMKGTSIEVNIPRDSVEAAKLYSKVFKLPAPTLDSTESVSKVFMNTIRTDGVGVDFICGRSVSREDPLPELGLEDFSLDDINTGFHLWAIDPGVTQPFVAVDGHEDNTHQVRQISAKEYYHLAGYDLTSAKLKAWKKKAHIDRTESQIPSPKTASKDVFDNHVRELLD